MTLDRGALTMSKFLSTPSARRATGALDGTELDITISIHALREEGDLDDSAVEVLDLHFYPRPPRGGRPDTAHKVNAKRAFLSTPSARRATVFF